MGDVDINKVKGVEPIQLKPLDINKIGTIEKIAPAAIHVKELNHIDPISVESLRIDEIRNLDPVRIDRFDVTHLPTVNLTLNRLPELDLNLRRLPPLAVGVNQDFVMPSEYWIRAQLLGIEFLRVHVRGQMHVHPRDRAAREVSASHQRSYRDVAPVGNPAIPVECREESAETVVHGPPPRRAAKPRPQRQHRHPHPRAARGGLSVGAPAFGFAAGASVESSVGSA
jgi:hypothetical protein